MRLTSETSSNGVSERLFTLADIPGVLWSPADATGSRPLVLLGHGGGQHKRVQGLVARAHRYVTACGFVVAAIDAPGHGDRPTTEHDERFAAGIRQRVAAGEPIGPQVARDNAQRAARAVPEWRATLDALQQLDCVGAGGPVGVLGRVAGQRDRRALRGGRAEDHRGGLRPVGHEALAGQGVRARAAGGPATQELLDNRASTPATPTPTRREHAQHPAPRGAIELTRNEVQHLFATSRRPASPVVLSP
jgi:hypothetical protein